MRTRNWRQPIVLTLLVLVALCSAAPAAWAGERYALLVAVGRYQDRTVPVLVPDGEQADTRLMSKALNKHGFAVTSLEERAATRQRVLSEMERLAARARSGDAVVFYFSGHGGRVNGRFSLCPWDALRGVGKNDITDQELSAWVQRLQTRNVTLILDCCFNEIVAKGIRRRPKFMPVRDQMPAQGLSIPADRAVVLRASADGEEAQQELMGGGKWVGVFTLQLYQELMRANPETTYQQLIQAVRHNVNQYIAKNYVSDPFNQDPQIEGSASQVDRRLFATSTPPSVATSVPYVVVRGVSRGKVMLDRGGAAGITDGSEYAVFPPNESAFTPERRVATLRVVSVSDDTATAIVVEKRSPGDVRAECRAIETRHAQNVVGQARVGVRLEGAPADRKAVGRALAALGFVDVDSTRPDLIVRISAMQQHALSGALYATDGKTPVPVDAPATAKAASPDALVAQLAPAIENLYVLRGLTSLQNPNPTFRVSLQTNGSVYRLGDHLQVRLRADQDCYVALLHVDANGVPRVLLPNQHVPEIRLQKGREYVIPSPESGVLGSMVVTKPTGRETLIALATLTPVDWTVVARNATGPEPPVLGSKGLNVQVSRVQNLPLAQWSTALVNLMTEMPAARASRP